MYNHEFRSNPVDVSIERSRFDFNSNLKTTFDQGDLVPIYCTEVLPGDTFSMDTSLLCRMSTPIFPVMDDAFLDLYWFFVPNRILWDKWKNFLGENTSGPWAEDIEYTVPQLCFDRSWTDGAPPDRHYGAKYTLSNYLGVPSYLPGDDLTISDLPNRAYRMIWNEFFRDQNLQSPLPVFTDSFDRSFCPLDAAATNDSPLGYGSQILKSCRLHDYFSSALPSPQKGDPVTVSLGSLAPVNTGSSHSVPGLASPMSFTGAGYDSPVGAYQLGLINSSSDQSAEAFNGYLGGMPYEGSNTDFLENTFTPNNLWADLSGVSGFDINTLREAFAIQRLLEKQARGGSRYREILLSMFGVQAPDASMQIPEYLGGARVCIGMDQVVQTSASDEVSPQGNTSAYSLTTSHDNMFTKSFTEHGILMCVATVRVNHSYSQGVERWLRRKSRYDFYWPSLAHLGEQAIMQSEIFCDGSELSLLTPFGYNEAWADYRYKPNRLSGKFMSDTQYGLSSLGSAWTYGDSYSSAPSLGSAWITENNDNIQRTLAVQNEPQFIADFYFKANVTRCMPLYSIPGLIDHY